MSSKIPKYDLQQGNFLKGRPPDKDSQPKERRSPKSKNQTPKKATESRLSNSKEANPSKIKPLPAKLTTGRFKVITKTNKTKGELVNNPTQQTEVEKKRKMFERSPNSQSQGANLPASKLIKNSRITQVDSSIEGSTDSICFLGQEMNQIWDNSAESLQENFENASPASTENSYPENKKKIEKNAACVNNVLQEQVRAEDIEGKPINSLILANQSDVVDRIDSEVTTFRILDPSVRYKGGNILLSTDAELSVSKSLAENATITTEEIHSEESATNANLPIYEVENTVDNSSDGAHYAEIVTEISRDNTAMEDGTNTDAYDTPPAIDADGPDVPQSTPLGSTNEQVREIVHDISRDSGAMEIITGVETPTPAHVAGTDGVQNTPIGSEIEQTEETDPDGYKIIIQFSEADGELLEDPIAVDRSA